MDTYHPRLMIINFPDTDIKGHTGVWADYINALTNADNLVFQLWQHVQAGDYGYSTSNTTMFVTNDHGRHDDAHGGFQNHGDDCDGCEHIMLLTVGRNVSAGLVNNDLHYQIELAATVGDLLNFSTSQAIGISLYQGSNPLPVELTFFSAKVLENAVKLNWRTETEVDNYGFDIERKNLPINPRQGEENNGWGKIGFIEGNGNSNSPKEYSFADRSATNGKYSYRLKQIDNDGQFEYSNIIEIEIAVPDNFELSQNYPNPFNPSTLISFSIPTSGFITLKVYDVLGNEVATLVNEEKQPGVYEITWNAENISSGIYLYQLKAGNFTQTKKLILMK
jgi:hypothetical protein